jgi:hypothetical protein
MVDVTLHPAADNLASCGKNATRLLFDQLG